MSQPIFQNAIINGSNITHSCITLKNGEISRQFLVDSNWVKLRIITTVTLTTGSTFAPITGNPKLIFGLLSGSVLYSSASSGHFFGVKTMCPSTTNIDYSNYIRCQDFGGSSNYAQIILKTGSLAPETMLQSVNNDMYISTESQYTPLHSSLLAFDILRPSSKSGSYNYKFYYNYNYSNVLAHTFTDFEILRTAAYDSLPTDGVYALTQNLSSTANINERDNGQFDRIYVGWNREYPDPDLKILTMLVSVLQ